MKSFLEFKYNSDLLKFAGIALCSPASSLIFNFIVFNSDNRNFDAMLILRITLAVILFLGGLIVIARGREILEDVDNVSNKLK